MLHKASRHIRIAVVDVVEVVISSCDQRALPHHRDGVGSGAGFHHLQVTTWRWWSWGRKKLLGGGGSSCMA